MKKFSFQISTILLLSLLAACANNDSIPETNEIETIVAGTLSAIPTTTLTSIPFTPTATLTTVPPTSTTTPIQTLAPLYSEVTWENLGPSEQEILVNEQTNERITLPGYIFQASMPLEDNLVNNVYMYYSNENMASIGWAFMGGWGGTLTA